MEHFSTLTRKRGRDVEWHSSDTTPTAVGKIKSHHLRVTYDDGKTEDVPYREFASKADETYLARTRVKGDDAIVKFTNEIDAKLHRELYENPETRPYVVPLIGSGVKSVEGTNNRTRGHYKISKFIEPAKRRRRGDDDDGGSREERLAKMKRALEPHIKGKIRSDDWQKNGNVLWHDGQPLAHDFDV